MVTRKQSKEYERLHKVLIDTYHEKESGREKIVLLFEGVAIFFDTLLAEKEITFQEQNIYNASPQQQESLKAIVIDYGVFTGKVKKYGEDTVGIYEEVENCMETMVEVCAQLGSEATDKKASEIILNKMGNRIELSKEAISRSIIELNELIKTFDGFNALYNSRKN